MTQVIRFYGSIQGYYRFNLIAIPKWCKKNMVFLSQFVISPISLLFPSNHTCINNKSIAPALHYTVRSQLHFSPLKAMRVHGTDLGANCNKDNKRNDG